MQLRKRPARRHRGAPSGGTPGAPPVSVQPGRPENRGSNVTVGTSPAGPPLKFRTAQLAGNAALCTCGGAQQHFPTSTAATAMFIRSSPLTRTPSHAMPKWCMPWKAWRHPNQYWYILSFALETRAR